MMLIVCDTGPLLHLAEANLLNLLQQAGKVCIPDMVDQEVKELFGKWEKSRPDWLIIEALLPEDIKEAELLYNSDLMDYGEAEAIILAKRLNADWFVTDDTEARVFAHALGMEVHGSLGVVLWCAATGHLSYKKSKDALKSLAKTSLWISEAIMAEANAALKVIFEG